MGLPQIAATGTGALAPGNAWQSLRGDKSLQFDFPDEKPLPPAPPWFMRLIDFLRLHEKWFEYGAWVLLALFALAAAWYFFRHFRDRGKPETERQAPRRMAPWQPSASQARLSLTDADALAAEGRYDRAAHLLLLVCVQHIREQRPGAVTPALTSREIAALPGLSAMARDVFAGIARVVERSHFGGAALGPAEFRLCREAFERFTVPELWREAA